MDCNKSIELNSTLSSSYGSRGIAKARIGNLPGVILDFEAAIELNPTDEEAYFNQGTAIEMSNQLPMACADWVEAKKLGSSQAKLFGESIVSINRE